MLIKGAVIEPIYFSIQYNCRLIKTIVKSDEQFWIRTVNLRCYILDFFFLLGMSLLDLISFSSSSGTPVNLGEKRFQNSGLNEFHLILHLLIGRRDHRNFLRVTHILLALISIPFHSLHRNYSLLSSSIEFSNEK